MAHPLADVLRDAARGVFPPVDGRVTVLPDLPGGRRAVVSFTGHSVIAADVDAAELIGLGADGWGGANHPRVLLRLAEPDGTVGTTDALLTARATGDGDPLPERADLADHPRVRHARRARDAVRVHADDTGLVTVGSGLGGVVELGIELFAPGAIPGTGRALIRRALATIPSGTPVFAGVTGGNARSLRSFLSAGFVPIGSVTLVLPRG